MTAWVLLIQVGEPHCKPVQLMSTPTLSECNLVSTLRMAGSHCKHEVTTEVSKFEALGDFLMLLQFKTIPNTNINNLIIQKENAIALSFYMWPFQCHESSLLRMQPHKVLKGCCRAIFYLHITIYYHYLSFNLERWECWRWDICKGHVCDILYMHNTYL